MLEIAALACFFAVLLPPTVYITVKMARVGYLRANQFSQPTKEDEQNGN